MGRLRSLLAKEIQQHLVAWLALLALQGFSVLVLLLRALDTPTGVSLLEAYGALLVLFVPVAAMILGNRLVVAEYHGRTQLFVESLPMRRSEMAWTKFFLGWLVLLLGCGIALGLAALFASFREPLGFSFIALVAARSTGFVLCVWAFFFTMGFTGRLRIPIYLALLLGVGMLDGVTELELERFGPFALAAPSTLPFERGPWPWQALTESLLLGLTFCAVGIGLAVIKEGTVAESLSRRMSHREKAIIAFLFVGLLMAFAFYEGRREKEPYAFDLPEVVASEVLPLEILYLRPALRRDGEQLLGHLENELQDLGDLLDTPLPALRVAYYGSLDGRTFDWATLRSNDGLLLRANFEAAVVDRDALTAEVVAKVIAEVTRGRADFEPRAWVWDGFGLWWAGRSEGRRKGCQDPLPQALWTASASSVPPSASSSSPASAAAVLDVATVTSWWRLREARGDTAAAALAASGLWFLEERHGSQGVRDLAFRLWNPPAPRDVRGLWQERPFPEIFEKATGESWPTFVDAWQDHLRRLQGSTACSSRAVPTVHGEMRWDTSGEGSPRWVYAVHFAEEPPQGTLVRLLHGRLGPFDHPLDEDDLKREEHLWTSGVTASFHLDGVYGRGSRTFFALEVELPEPSGRPLRLQTRRLEVP